MELEISSWSSLAFFISILFLLFTKNILKKHANPKLNLPPSPPSLPIIGHLHLLKEPLHRTLHHMARKYGDVLLLRFGTRDVVVVSSYSATEECFTKNDVAFSNRPQSLAGKHLNYNHKTIGFSNYSDHWRILRRLTAMELLSTNRIAMFAGSREEEARLMVKQIFQERQHHFNADHECQSKWTRVELRPKIVDLVFNIMMKMVAGKRYNGNGIVDEEARQFQSIMREISELLGSSTINDFLPFLQRIDFQGVEKRMIRVKEKMDSFFQSLVDDHRKIKIESGENNNIETSMSFVDVILSLQDSNPQAYDDETIKGLMLAMLLAGTDTAVITIEWAMSLLLNHANTMQKAWLEINANVGNDRLVNESDYSKLNFLQSVINETFRLFPGVPVILPRESSDDCTLSGFDIKKGTILLINAWSIHREEKQWEDATSFIPERFGKDGAEGSNKLLMFGGGRRICPGGLLARRVVCLGLGSLIQSFEWERIGADAIDLTEEPGLSMCKLHPLLALCKPRQPMIHILNKL